MADDDCPQGWRMMHDSQVTAAMSQRAVELLHEWRADPTAVPGVTCLAEWSGNTYVNYCYNMHPPDAQNPAEHTGVDLRYCPGKVPPPPPVAAPTGTSSQPPPAPSC
jgi:hypothetical protein